MNLKLECQGKEMVLAPGKAYTLGRAPECDFVVVSDRVSRRQLELRHDSSGWVITDLDSTNGSYVDGQVITTCKVAGKMRCVVGGRGGVELVLEPVGSAGSEMIVPTLIEQSAAILTEAAPSIVATPIIRLHKSPFYIGRDLGNDWVLPDLLVSRKHAEIRRLSAGDWEIVDTNSSNGTFVNGKRLPKQTPVRLSANSMIAIGRVVVRFAGEALEAPGAGDAVELLADGLSMQRGRAQLLQKVSFRLAPRSLTAVIGPSGAGKSTLLGALTGQMPATSGSVFVAGRDLYSCYAELRNRIGLVPQQDLLHTNLTTQQALEFGAALRFPRDTTAAERSARVLEVLRELDLLERAHQRIDKLSGGQKKRTNVALELLTKPALLFLDEPTSGLDPGLDRQVMNLLRDLADKGQTVVVVTHAMDHLNACDNIVILGVGGVLAYFGPPAGVFSYFATDSWAGVFGKLNKPQGIFNSAGGGAGPVQRLAPIRQQSWWFQVVTLVKRYIAVITADRTFVSLLVLMPLIMAAVGFIAGSDAGLGGGEPGAMPPNIHARSLLLLLVLGAAFMGTAASIQEVIKERAIHERERSFGLSGGAYLASKVIVLGVITAVQAAMFAGLALGSRAGPQEPLLALGGHFEIILVVVLLAVVSMGVGLLVSTLLASGESSMPVLVVLTMAQVVLSGAIQLRIEWVLEWFGWLDPSYWAMNAMSMSVNLLTLSGLEATYNHRWWIHAVGNWNASIFNLAVIAAVVVVAIMVSMQRSEIWRSLVRVSNLRLKVGLVVAVSALGAGLVIFRGSILYSVGAIYCGRGWQIEEKCADPAAAFGWFSRAAVAGNSDAAVVTGSFYCGSDWVVRAICTESGVAKEWFTKSANNGNMQGMRALGRLACGASWQDGPDCVAPKEARRWFQKAAEEGDIYSMTALGKLLCGDPWQRGGPCDDIVGSQRWFQSAADLGDTFGMNLLGDTYCGDTWFLDSKCSDGTAASAWYEKAANAGDTYAMLRLGQLGCGSEWQQGGSCADLGVAQRWFRGAADGGDIHGMIALADSYCGAGNWISSGRCNGSEAARRWFLVASDRGDLYSKRALGTLACGAAWLKSHVCADFAAARPFFQEAASAGLPGDVWTLANLFRSERLWKEQLEVYEEALNREPENPYFLNGVAWLLLVGQSTSLRDPERALKLSLRAVALDREPMYLDTLATAWWAAGAQGLAIDNETEAIRADPEEEFFEEQIRRFRTSRYYIFSTYLGDDNVGG